ncbi:phosphonoacetate hydrolase [Roseomonas harenae]|uniref:phosphonoacetate hydrolase n=1 Tax=Muricoccus harenae TaxID=2692566 RepID=UPI001331B749
MVITRPVLEWGAQLDDTSRAIVVANGRAYRLPQRPVAVLCLDGLDPAYLNVAFADGDLPAISACRDQGFLEAAEAAMPTFTNPNNVSIATGSPPSVHGVSGNYYLDRETGKEVMVTGEELLTAPTVFAALAHAGLTVAVVTAKDKLRVALSHGLPPGSVSVSAERSGTASLETNGLTDIPTLVGRPQPDQYSADLSLFVLDLGLQLLQSLTPPSLMYLSLSDYVQHLHAPDAPEARDFLRQIDRRIGQLVADGCLVAATADHGMSDMAWPDGTPRVAYLGDALDAALGAGVARVICPITDPFVRHHGAMGGFVRVHLPDVARDAARSVLEESEAVSLVLTREEACTRFEMPPGPEGDLAVVAAPGWALGSRSNEHDLSALAGARLRSHGGLAERMVPFLLSAPLTTAWRDAHPNLRNFDILDAALNGVAE